MHTQKNSVLVRMEGIHKTFPGVKALQDAQISLNAGEVHVLMGENGAGKSTLMKILCGSYQADSGSIAIDGKPVKITSPHSARQNGIVMIHQELLMAENVTVAENIFMGREFLHHGIPGLINRKKMEEEADRILNGTLQANIPVNLPVNQLSVAHKQMVEIAKALSTNARVIVMDEPTSSLGESEIQTLFSLIRQLKSQGTCIVYISHRMEEIFEIGDRVTVMRDGCFVQTCQLSTIDMDTLVQLMVGRKLEEKYPVHKALPGDTILKVKHLNRKGELFDINLEVRRGEVLGIFGLVGAKRTEMAKAIFGARPIDSGEVEIQGQTVKIRSTKDAIRNGIALIPEDRKLEGLVGIMSVRDNIALPILPALRKGLFLSRKKASQIAEQYIEKLSIKTPDLHRAVRNLSGGNQQKVVIAQWLASNSKVVIFDEPTRGIDVGAKLEIYRIMNQLLEQGTGIIMISSEMPELLGVSDRIVVMKAGHLVAEFSKNSATQEEILKCAM